MDYNVYDLLGDFVYQEWENTKLSLAKVLKNSLKKYSEPSCYENINTDICSIFYRTKAINTNINYETFYNCHGCPVWTNKEESVDSEGCSNLNTEEKIAVIKKLIKIVSTKEKEIEYLKDAKTQHIINKIEDREWVKKTISKERKVSIEKLCSCGGKFKDHPSHNSKVRYCVKCGRCI